MKIIFLALKNADMTEGRGPMVTEAAFAKEIDANTFTDKQPGVMGRMSEKGWSKEKYGDWEVKPLVVFESLEEKIAWDNGKTRRRALAKLTPEERAALGLTD